MHSIISPELQLKRLQEMMHWLISGVNRHCIPTYLWNSEFLTPEWVEQTYQIQFSKN